MNKPQRSGTGSPTPPEHGTELRRVGGEGSGAAAADGRRREDRWCPRRVRLLLRPPGGQAAPWKHEIPAYLFLGGVAAGSSLLGAGADLRAARPAPDGTASPPSRRQRQLARAGQRPRPARALRQHAAHVQADLADVGRHLDPHRVRSGRLSGRRGRGRRSCCPAGSVRWAACSARPPDRRGWPRLSRPGRRRRTPRCC